MPEGAGAVLAAALEPGDDAVVGEHLGDRLGEVGGPLVGDAGGAQPAASISVVGPAAAEVGAAASARRRRRSAAPRAARAPSAVPASPAAGCTQTSLERALSARSACWRRS